MALQVSSPAFAEAQMIPIKYTCDGENISPPLEWNGQPKDTRSVAIICDDPDAPSGTFTHWVLYDIAGHTHQLLEGLSGDGKHIDTCSECTRSTSNPSAGRVSRSRKWNSSFRETWEAACQRAT